MPSCTSCPEGAFRWRPGSYSPHVPSAQKEWQITIAGAKGIQHSTGAGLNLETQAPGKCGIKSWDIHQSTVHLVPAYNRPISRCLKRRKLRSYTGNALTIWESFKECATHGKFLDLYTNGSCFAICFSFSAHASKRWYFEPLANTTTLQIG